MTRRVDEQSTSDILRMVRLALDEFDAVPLQASVRRAIRIAVALDDTQTVVRLTQELRPHGGHKLSNRADIQRLIGADPALAPDLTGPAERGVESYIADRGIRGDSEGRLYGHSLDQIDFWLRVAVPLDQTPDSLYEAALSQQESFESILGLARFRTFNALCGWERQLTFSVTNRAILAEHQARVDAALAKFAPDVLDQFNVVFRRLDEAVRAESESVASESLAEAVTTCRRILKSVVDLVQPADPAKPVSADGLHDLNDSAYKNRLFEFLKASTSTRTMSSALKAASQSLWDRFDAVDTLASKGVHADVARDEAELCALNTYLIAGEVLGIQSRQSEVVLD